MSKIFRAVITGAPASGKGTISKLIATKFCFAHISPGDILRLQVREGTELGKQAKQYMEKGQLLPDKLVFEMLKKHLKELSSSSWILDGFPRTLKQAEQLDESVCVDAVLNLIVPHKEIIERVKNRWIHLPSGRVYNIGFSQPKVPGKDDVTGEDLVQRPDDKPEIVKKRLQLYEEQIKPVLDFYKKKKLVTNFEAKPASAIWDQIEKFLNERVCSHTK